MNREIPRCDIGGSIYYHGHDINTPRENLFELRKSIGMVFQQPTPFRKSIRENILFAPRRHGHVAGRDEADALVEESLRQAALWEEVRDKLDRSALALSGGQQRRLCIARTLAMRPDAVSYTHLDVYKRQMQLSMIFVMVTMADESARRISEVLEAEPTIGAPEQAVTEVADGSIDFDHVSFKYLSLIHILHPHADQAGRGGYGRRRQAPGHVHGKERPGARPRAAP